MSGNALTGKKERMASRPSYYLSSACDQCFRTKVRCDSTKPECNQCRKSERSCTYSTSKQSRKGRSHRKQGSYSSQHAQEAEMMDTSYKEKASNELPSIGQEANLDATVDKNDRIAEWESCLDLPDFHPREDPAISSTAPLSDTTDVLGTSLSSIMPLAAQNGLINQNTGLSHSSSPTTPSQTQDVLSPFLLPVFERTVIEGEYPETWPSSNVIGTSPPSQIPIASAYAQNQTFLMPNNFSTIPADKKRDFDHAEVVDIISKLYRHQPHVMVTSMDRSLGDIRQALSLATHYLDQSYEENSSQLNMQQHQEEPRSTAKQLNSSARLISCIHLVLQALTNCLQLCKQPNPSTFRQPECIKFGDLELQGNDIYRSVLQVIISREINTCLNLSQRLGQLVSDLEEQNQQPDILAVRGFMNALQDLSRGLLKQPC